MTRLADRCIFVTLLVYVNKLFYTGEESWH